MTSRFSKASLAADLQGRINSIVLHEGYAFTTQTGSVQVRAVAQEKCAASPRDGFGYWREQTAIKYGEWSALCNLAERLHLDVYPEGAGIEAVRQAKEDAAVHALDPMLPYTVKLWVRKPATPGHRCELCDAPAVAVRENTRVGGGHLRDVYWCAEHDDPHAASEASPQ